jgi:GT2 family glycosyltransferase
MKDFSLIIVHFHTPQFLKTCLHSILNQKWSNLKWETIVINNQSQGQYNRLIQGQLPQSKIINNRFNLGFGRAVNQGIKISKGHFIVILNPDIVLSNNNQWEKLIDYLNLNKKVGAVTGRLAFPNGQIQFNARTFPNPSTIIYRYLGLEKFYLPSFYRRHLMIDQNHQQIFEADWALGALLVIRRKTLNQVGLFDERFFLYYEDIDWCFRAKKKGWKIIYYPEIKATHHYQRQSARHLFNRLTFIHFKSILYYFYKRMVGNQ